MKSRSSQSQTNALDLTFIDDYAYAQHGPVIHPPSPRLRRTSKRRLARPAGVANLKRWAKKEMSLDLPAKCADKAAGFPEYSYGLNRVTLILKDGKKVPRVLVAWGGEIVEIDGAHIEGEESLGFDLDDVTDVEPCP